jgi:hypothetical protein
LMSMAETKAIKSLDWVFVLSASQLSYDVDHRHITIQTEQSLKL